MKKAAVFFMLLLLIISTVVRAEDLNGEEILNRMDKTMKAESKYMEEEMVLITSSGQERSRTVAVWNKNTEADENMLLKFLSPANIEGTSFLMVNDDMWLYLPALGKVKRIAGSARQGDFMGSDLSYEDMEALGSSGFSADYQVESVEIVDFEEQTAYKMELLPVGEDGSYSKLELKVDREIFLPLQILYFNQEGEVEKELKTFNHEEIDGRWTAMKIVVENQAKGSRTILKVNQVDFDQEIDDRIFSTRYLERGN